MNEEKTIDWNALPVGAVVDGADVRKVYNAPWQGKQKESEMSKVDLNEEETKPAKAASKTKAKKPKAKKPDAKAKANGKASAKANGTGSQREYGAGLKGPSGTIGKKAKPSATHYDKALYVIAQPNRQRDSKGMASTRIIAENPGILYQDFVEKGGRSQDLRYDIEKGTVKVQEAKKAAPKKLWNESMWPSEDE